MTTPGWLGLRSPEAEAQASRHRTLGWRPGRARAIPPRIFGCFRHRPLQSGSRCARFGPRSSRIAAALGEMPSAIAIGVIKGLGISEIKSASSTRSHPAGLTATTNLVIVSAGLGRNVRAQQSEFGLYLRRPRRSGRAKSGITFTRLRRERPFDLRPLPAAATSFRPCSLQSAPPAGPAAAKSSRAASPRVTNEPKRYKMWLCGRDNDGASNTRSRVPRNGACKGTEKCPYSLRQQNGSPAAY